VPDFKHIAVGDNHRRATRRTPALLDEALCTFERYAAGAVARWPLYAESDNLTESQKRDLKAGVARLRRLLIDGLNAIALIVSKKHKTE
jgi:hypothetical protein